MKPPHFVANNTVGVGEHKLLQLCAYTVDETRHSETKNSIFIIRFDDTRERKLFNSASAF